MISGVMWGNGPMTGCAECRRMDDSAALGIRLYWRGPFAKNPRMRARLKSLFAHLLALFCVLWACDEAAAQYELRGTVTDKSTGETIIGAIVKVKGEAKGVSTDLDGKFVLKVSQLPPFTISITSMGYAAQEVEVASLDQPIKASLGADEVMLKEALVVKERISDKQKQAALTVETMDLIAIKEAPSGDFYESLGTLKGVDMTAASFGFKVINTRGFNSTSPVRSLQLIDGVDNQSPGLNFSLGNFLDSLATPDNALQATQQTGIDDGLHLATSSSSCKVTALSDAAPTSAPRRR